MIEIDFSAKIPQPPNGCSGLCQQLTNRTPPNETFSFCRSGVVHDLAHTASPDNRTEESLHGLEFRLKRQPHAPLPTCKGTEATGTVELTH